MSNGVTAPAQHELIVHWDNLKRELGIVVNDPHQAKVVDARVLLRDLIRQTGLSTEEMQAIMREVSAPEHPIPLTSHHSFDIEPIRLAAIPERLDGLTVLDVGGYDGYFAEVCLQRGAASAVVYDSYEWADYHWAKPIPRPGVVYQRGNLMDFGWRAPQPADVVLFFNVIYHVRDPWSALERIRLLTRQKLVICTSFVPGLEPTWQIVSPRDPGQGLVNDTFTVFWKPTLAGLNRLLEQTGFTVEAVHGPIGDHIVLVCT